VSWRRPAPDPFAALGLAARPDLTDDDVRAAWRRVAAATHPDRADGGDPARFAAAAAAYTELRTRFGRGEAMADARSAGSPGRRRGAARIRRGRPGRLALRVLAAAAASAAAMAAAGSGPAGPALVTGVLTWLVLTVRQDLAPPPG
jgi:curved DNA-binding protein CbpA